MQSVVIVDYGSGNLHSASKAFERAARESEAAPLACRRLDRPFEDGLHRQGVRL